MMYSCIITFLWLFFLLFSCNDNKVEKSIEIQKRRLQIAQGMSKGGKTISDVCLTKMTNGINISTKNDDKLIQITLFHWSPETAQVVYDWEIINNDTLLTYHVANITLGTVPKGYRELEKFGDVLVDRKNYCISYKTLSEWGIIFFDIRNGQIENIWTEIPTDCKNNK